MDESLKADIMHWAAIYVRHLSCRSGPLSLLCAIGKSHAHWEQKDISLGSLGCQSHVLVQGQHGSLVNWGLMLTIDKSNSFWASSLAIWTTLSDNTHQNTGLALYLSFASIVSAG